MYTYKFIYVCMDMCVCIYIKILFSDEIPGGARRHSGIFLDLI